MLKVVIAGFARFLGLEVELLYFWLYGHAIKLDETVSDVCYIYSLFILMLLISLCSLAWKRVTLLKSKVDKEFNIHYFVDDAPLIWPNPYVLVTRDDRSLRVNSR